MYTCYEVVVVVVQELQKSSMTTTTSPKCQNSQPSVTQVLCSYSNKDHMHTAIKHPHVGHVWGQGLIGSFQHTFTSAKWRCLQPLIMAYVGHDVRILPVLSEHNSTRTPYVLVLLYKVTSTTLK